MLYQSNGVVATAGEHIDSKSIRKHKNDVFRLSELLDQNQEPLLEIHAAVKEDMRVFLERIASEVVDVKQLGIRGKTKEMILHQMEESYR